MGTQEWQIVIGVVTSAAITLGSWMFMVHAKLAVLAARIVDLADKMEKAAEANRELWTRSAHHETRLQTHDVQFAHVAERLEGIG